MATIWLSLNLDFFMQRLRLGWNSLLHTGSGFRGGFRCDFFVRWHGRDGVMRHPREMGGSAVTQFLIMFSNERRVSVSTQPGAQCLVVFVPRSVGD
jgi:hypothetical protein